MVGAGRTGMTRNKSSMIVRHFSNSPPGASAHAHWYCDKGGLAPRFMMYQSLFDRAVHGCTRRKSTLKDPPDCLPGVLCIPSLIVHGMTMGRCNAHLVIAIFHVFRTRLLRWPRLSLSSSGTAKKRRLLFQTLVHLCIYLSLTCVSACLVCKCSLKLGGAFEITKEKKSRFPYLLPTISILRTITWSRWSCAGWLRPFWAIVVCRVLNIRGVALTQKQFRAHGRLSEGYSEVCTDAFCNQ